MRKHNTKRVWTCEKNKLRCVWIIEIIQRRTSPGSMPTSLPSGCRFHAHDEHVGESTAGAGRWHRDRHFWKRSVYIPDDEWIVFYVLLFVHYGKKGFLLCGLLCGPRIQIYGFWILEVHQPTERGDSITVYILLIGAAC